MSTQRLANPQFSDRSEAVPLSVLLDDWVRRGVLSPEQAATLAEARDQLVLVEPTGAGRARSLLLEGVGYLGAAVVVAAVGLLAAQYWDELRTSGRLALLGAAWLVMAVAALAAPFRRGAAWSRLTSVLLLASTAALAGLLAVFATGVLDLTDAEQGVFVGWITASYAAVVWWQRPGLLQQGATMVALGMAGAALIAQQPVPAEMAGLSLWTVGVGWWLLAWSGLTHPRRLGFTAGGAMAVLGAMITSSSVPGTVLLLLTIALLGMLALRLHDLFQLGIAGIAIVLNVPAAVERWFPGSVVAPLALLITGIAVVAVAVMAARRGAGIVAREGDRPGSPTLALVAISVLVPAVAAVVVNAAR